MGVADESKRLGAGICMYFVFIICHGRTSYVSISGRIWCYFVGEDPSDIDYAHARGKEKAAFRAARA